MHVDTESGDFEQFVQEFPRCLHQVYGEVGQCVQAADVGRRPLAGQVRRIQPGDVGQRAVLLLLEIVVLLAETEGKRVIRVAFPGLPHDRILLAGDRRQRFLLARSFGLSLPGCGVVDAVQLSFEDRLSFRAEEAVGVEPADGFEQLVLAHPDRRREAGVEFGRGLVVLARPAQVVRGSCWLLIAGHAAATAVVHSPAQEVFASGERVVVERVAVA
ncbi:hypothetical protein [Amycolatopsis sp. cmx-4-83]|uniref:hypothetical protein n=1 Tax=Amycolatopsis sp. cmx-4-83 TaxID=2790940 RepID=UPI0039798B7B